MFNRIGVYLLPIAIVLSFFERPWFPYGVWLSGIAIFICFIFQMLQGCKDKSKLPVITEVDVGAWILISLSLLPTVMGGHPASHYIWIIRLISVYLTYRFGGHLVNALGKDKVIQVIIVVGCISSVGGIFIPGVWQLQGFIIGAGVCAALSSLVSLSCWSSVGSFCDQYKYGLILFTHLFFLLTLASRTLGLAFLLAILIYLIANYRYGIQIMLLRIMVAGVPACIFYGISFLYPGWWITVASYLLGLGLSCFFIYLLESKFGKQHRLKLFWASLILVFVFGSGIVSFVITDELLRQYQTNFTWTNPLTNSYLSFGQQAGSWSLWVIGCVVFAWLRRIIVQLRGAGNEKEHRLLAAFLAGALFVILGGVVFNLTPIYPALLMIGLWGSFGQTRWYRFTDGDKDRKNRWGYNVIRVLVATGLVALIGFQSYCIAELYYVRQGDHYLEVGKGEQAREMFVRASEIGLVNRDYGNRFMLVADQMGDQQQLINHLEEMLALDPSNRELNLRLGDLYFLQGNLDPAEQYYWQITQSPDFYLPRYEQLAVNYLGKAKELIRQRERDEAEQLLFAILDIYERMEIIHDRTRLPGEEDGQYIPTQYMKLVMGKAHYYLRQYEEAEVWARRAIPYPETKSEGIEILYYIRDQLEAGVLPRE